MLDIDLPWQAVLILSFGACTAYAISLIVYRLLFSPYAKYPGPKLAGATLWYEVYFNCIKGGGGVYFKEIDRLHTIYGPVVRVGPSEIHIKDSSFYETFYLHKLDKGPHYKTGGFLTAAFGTIDHDVHRKRRGAIAPFFTRSHIESEVPVVQQKVLKLCEKLGQFAASGEVFRVDHVFESVAMDVAQEIAYGKPSNLLDNPIRTAELSDNVVMASKMTHILRLFPSIGSAIATISNAIPNWAMKLIEARMATMAIFDLPNEAKKQVKEILQSKAQFLATDNPGNKVKHNIYHQLLSSDLPPADLTPQRLIEEGVSITTAGFTTTGRALTTGLTHLILNPAILLKLRSELSTIMPPLSSTTTSADLPSWSDLQSLSYLSAVVKESIRLSWGAAFRLNRTTKTPISYSSPSGQAYVFPPGTSISFTNPDVLMDPDHFPEPEVFRPERWIEGGKALDRYWVPFGKGARMCVGMWLALAEMEFVLAVLVERFEIELVGCDERNVRNERDWGMPFAAPGFEGVKVRFRIRE